MTARERKQLRDLRREVRWQRGILATLAKALHTHARTDLAPDAALPSLRRLQRRIDLGAA